MFGKGKYILSVLIVLFIYASCSLEGDVKTPADQNDGLLLITSVAVTITGPVKNVAPLFGSASAGENFTVGAIVWSAEDGLWNPQTDVFRGGVSYTAMITLTANEKYAFAGDLSTKINGNDADVSDNTGSAVKLTYQFSATDVKVINGISVETQPEKLVYVHGDALDLTGLVVLFNYDDGTSEEVEADDFAVKGITTDPENGSSLSRAVYNEQPVILLFDEIETETEDLTVSKKPVTISVSIANKTYDAGFAATVSGTPSINGLIGSDVVTVIPGTAVFDDKNAGGYKIVTFSGWGIAGNDADNYFLDGQPSATAGIYPASIECELISISNTIFTPLSGETKATVNFKVTGFLSEGPFSLRGEEQGFSLSDNILTYDGKKEFSNTSVKLEMSVIAGDNYVGNITFNITVYTGIMDFIEGDSYIDFRIPVKGSNIKDFNTYANSEEGLSRHYKLTQNVTLPAPTSERGNWTAIGLKSSGFTGSFDGQNFTINNLIIDNDVEYQGMFSQIDGFNTTIRNVRLSGGSVKGGMYTGNIAGANHYGTIKNCSVTGSVSGRDYVGGIAGYNHGTIQNCYFGTGSVTGKQHVGGIVGQDSDGFMLSCYVTGSVEGENNVGGIVGHNYRGTVQNCYTTCSVNGSDGHVGGLVGVNDGVVQNCYATGSISAGIDNVGGVVGVNSDNYGNSKVLYCVALNPIITAAYNNDSYIGRITGENYNELNYNYAGSEMKLWYGWREIYSDGNAYTPVPGLDLKDGATITETQWNSATWWENTAKFSSDAWTFRAGLPILKSMPAGTQNPVLQ